MSDVIQIRKSLIAKNRPPNTALYGEPYVNLADMQFGVMDNNTPSNYKDLIGVRFFSTLAQYSVGDHVINAGFVYRCTTAITTPGAFNPTQWMQIGGSVTVGDTAPSNPQPGGMWFCSTDANLYIYYNDGNSSQWVIANNFGGAATTVVNIGTSPPANPVVGQLWWDSNGGQMYIWFNDGSSSQWVVATNSGGAFVPVSGGTMSGPLFVPGVVDGSAAGVGMIGEVLTASLASGSAVSIATNTQTNVLKLSLTAGDWDVSGNVAIGGTSPVLANFYAWTCLGAVTAPGIGSPNENGLAIAGIGTSSMLPVGPQQFNLSAPGAVWLNAQVGITSGTPTVYGSLRARRMR